MKYLPPAFLSLRTILFFLLTASVIACSKPDDNTGNNPPPPPPPPPPPVSADTLNPGWTKVIVPSLEQPYDIFFVNKDTGFLTAGHSIYRSVNGGNTWQKVFQTNFSTFYNIGMASSSKAIFVRPNGYQIIVTSDGGNSFDSAQINDNEINDVYFVSPAVAYAAGKKIWKSVDGGITWTSIYNLNTGSMKMINFLDVQKGWITDTTGLYSTSNGGVNWTKQNPPGFNFGNGTFVNFVDPNNGFMSDGPGIGKTIDGGANWTKLNMLLHTGFHDLSFITPLLGFVADNRRIYKTEDGGSTWTNEVRMASGTFINEVHFIDANHGWAIAQAGYILKYEK